MSNQLHSDKDLRDLFNLERTSPHLTDKAAKILSETNLQAPATTAYDLDHHSVIKNIGYLKNNGLQKVADVRLLASEAIRYYLAKYCNEENVEENDGEINEITEVDLTLSSSDYFPSFDKYAAVPELQTMLQLLFVDRACTRDQVIFDMDRNSSSADLCLHLERMSLIFKWFSEEVVEKIYIVEEETDFKELLKECCQLLSDKYRSFASQLTQNQAASK